MWWTDRGSYDISVASRGTASVGCGLGWVGGLEERRGDVRGGEGIEGLEAGLADVLLLSAVCQISQSSGYFWSTFAHSR